MAEYPNPYVGPRELRQGEAIHGRTHETGRLLDLLIAERIVLLYSPSGAGKTSLIQAALMPALRDENFMVLPPVRVNQALPPDAPTSNRHVLSALQGWEAGRADTHLSAPQLARRTLAQYLEERFGGGEAGAAGQPVVLIFDQFEEILTTDPNNFDAKTQFFAQLSEALTNRRFWALFSMREDYRAALDPYLRPVPTRFANTFRLDFLKKKAAQLAIQRPAQDNGVDFTDAAALKLAEDLAQIIGVDGKTEVGEYIEPVQLQVVCLRLWEKLAPRWQSLTPEQVKILPDDVEETGDVNGALAEYYAAKVRDAAADPDCQQRNVTERAIRDWFENELITREDTRNQVRRGPSASGSLDNAAIRPLASAYLVRGEDRRTGVYYELAHDRLIKPVRDDNAAFYKTLQAFQQQAILWAKDESPTHLLRGAALDDAEAWAKANTVTPEENKFLDKCRTARRIEEREQYLNYVARIWAIATSIIGIIALAMVVVVWRDSRLNREETLLSSTHEIALQSEIKKVQNFNLTVLLALKSAVMHENQVARTHQWFTPLMLDTAFCKRVEDDLRPSGQLSSSVRRYPTINTYLHGQDGLPLSLAWSSDGRWLASGTAGSSIALWDTTRRQSPEAAATNYQNATLLKGHQDTVQSIAFSADSKFLASGSLDHTVILWDVAQRRKVWQSPEVRSRKSEPVAVRCVALSPDGQWLAAGDGAGFVSCWDTRNWKQPPLRIETGGDKVYSLAWSPRPLYEGRFGLATGDNRGNVALWDIKHPETSTSAWQDTSAVNALAFSPDGKMLASGGGDSDGGTVVLRDYLHDYQLGLTLTTSSTVQTLAFSPNGKMLATGDSNLDLTFWDTNTNQQIGEKLRGHTNTIYCMAFHPGGKLLASGSWDGNVILWNVPSQRRDRFITRWDTFACRRLDRVLPIRDAYIMGVGFIPKSDELASVDLYGNLLLHDVKTGALRAQPLSNQASNVLKIAYSPNGRLFATAHVNGLVLLWDARTHRQLGILRGHTDSVWGLAWRRDSRVLASSGDDDTIRLWDVTAQRPIGEPLCPRAGDVAGVAFSPDGKLLAAACADGAEDDHWVTLWDLSKSPFDALPPLSGHKNAVQSVVFSADGKRLASGDLDGLILLWDVTTPSQPVVLKRFTEHKKAIHDLAFNPDKTWPVLASASEDGDIRFWDAITPMKTKSVGVLKRRGLPMWGIAFSPNGKLLVAGGATKTIQLWDVAKRKSLNESVWKDDNPPHTSCVNTVAFSPDGKMLASGGDDARLWLWNVQDFQKSNRPTVALQNFKGSVSHLACSHDGQWLALSRSDGTITLWNRKTNSAFNLPAPDFNDAPLRKWDCVSALCLAFHPNSSQLAVGYDASHNGYDDGHLVVWNINTRHQLLSLRAIPRYGVASLAFNSDGTMLVTGNGDYSLALWDYQSSPPHLTPRRTLHLHRTAVMAVAFSPDGKILASGGKDGPIILTNPDSGKQIAALNGHYQRITALAFSPDGKFLASGSTDNTVIVWDVKSHQIFGQPFSDYIGDVECLAWSADSQWLASGSDDKTVIFRDFDPQHWKSAAAQVANRNLNQAEWDQFIGPENPYRRTMGDFPSGEGAPADAPPEQ